VVSSPTRTPPSTTTRLGLTLVGAGAAFAALAYGVRGGRSFSWDRGPVDFFDEHYYDLDALRAVTEAAVWSSLAVGGLVSLALAAVLALHREYRRALFWGATVVGVLVLTTALKALIKRPEIGEFDTEYSFPSGNATASMAAVAALALLTQGRTRRIVLLVGAVAVAVYGVALVLLLWHYPSDVVAGWMLGLALVAALRLSFGDVAGPITAWPRPPFWRSPSRAP
jgi:membrane-associated phospholipid phosphatase